MRASAQATEASGEPVLPLIEGSWRVTWFGWDGAVAGLADDEHAVAARDQLPDHRRSGQFPGHEKSARRLRVREQEQVLLPRRPRVGVRAHPVQISPAPARDMPG